MFVYFSTKYRKSASFLLCLLLISRAVFPQDAAQETAPEATPEADTQAVPDALRIPERGEAPRYPKDMVIGELGRAEAPEEAYLLARRILQALTAGRRDAPVFADGGSIFTGSVYEEVRSISPRSYRIGGGRTEADGSVSFVVRFIGSQESITGELFLRRAETAEADGAGSPEAGRWLPDDISLETKRPLIEIRESYRYNFSPYERFY